MLVWAAVGVDWGTDFLAGDNDGALMVLLPLVPQAWLMSRDAGGAGRVVARGGLF